MRKYGALASFVLVLTVAAGTAGAERPPQARDEADHVVTGVIEKIETENSDFGGGTKTNYKATLRVSKVERGTGIKAGKPIDIHWFHVTRRPPTSRPGAYGHHYEAARKGAAVRVYLMNGYEWLEVIYNRDGIEAVKN
jgi:hypothetical protein